MTTRAECLDMLWAQAKDVLFITQDQYAQSLEDWEFDPLHRDDGSVSMIFVVRGPEFHFAKFGADVLVSRDHLRKYPGSLIQRYGYALTKTPKTDAKQARFNRRFGFYQIGEDEFDIHFRIDHLRVKETPCQSSQ
jgi:hypothetical protein